MRRLRCLSKYASPAPSGLLCKSSFEIPLLLPSAARSTRRKDVNVAELPGGAHNPLSSKLLKRTRANYLTKQILYICRLKKQTKMCV